MDTRFFSIRFSLPMGLDRFADHCASVVSNSLIAPVSLVGARHKELAVVGDASVSLGVAAVCLAIALWLLHHRSLSADPRVRRAGAPDKSDQVHRHIDLAMGNMADAAILPRWRQQSGASVSAGIFIGATEENGIVDSITLLPRRGWRKLRQVLHKIQDFRLDSAGRYLLNTSLQRLGYEKKARPFSDFITFKETQNAARALGISVGELIERKHMVGSKTALQQTMEGMASLGVLDGNVHRVCEIGPGSGRYLEQTLKLCKPKAYEIYETSPEWRDWLVTEFPVVARKCDGVTLSETETASVDLVQAHKVFPGLPLLMTLAYFKEMARVVREGGWIVFDIMTEQCFDAPHLQAWFDANPWNWDWSPRMCAVHYVLDMFAQQGICLTGSFLVPLHPGVTQYLVLRKGTPIH